MELIKCGDHDHAPAAVICVHLATGKSKEWCRVTVPDQEVDDWLCPECFSRIEMLGADDLRGVCIHCIDKLRADGEEVLGNAVPANRAVVPSPLATARGEHGSMSQRMSSLPRRTCRYLPGCARKSSG